MEKSEIRVDKALHFNLKNTVQAKQWLDKYYPNSAPLRQMVEKWFADFKRGRTNTDDAERSDRPNLAVVPENKKSPQNCFGRSYWVGNKVISFFS